MEQGLTEKEIIQMSPNPDRTRRLRNMPFKFLIYLSLFAPISYFLFGEPFLGFLTTSLVILWAGFIDWAQNHPRILERRPVSLMISILVLPMIAIMMFGTGYFKGVKLFRNPTPDSHITLVGSPNQKSVTLLRHLDKGLLVMEENNTISFFPWSEIKKIETPGKHIPRKGPLCSWFSWCNSFPPKDPLKQ